MKEDDNFFGSGWGKEVGYNKAAISIFTCEYVNIALKIGFHRAQLIIRRDLSKLPLEYEVSLLQL